MEWKAKKAESCGHKEFDKTSLRMNSVQVPQQDNYSDCGIFLLHYVETFFKVSFLGFISFKLAYLFKTFEIIFRIQLRTFVYQSTIFLIGLILMNVKLKEKQY